MCRIKLNPNYTYKTRRPAYRRRVPNISLLIDNEKLNIFKSIKYLGETFTNLYRFSQRTYQKRSGQILFRAQQI